MKISFFPIGCYIRFPFWKSLFVRSLCQAVYLKGPDDAITWVIIIFYLLPACLVFTISNIWALRSFIMEGGFTS